MQRATAQRLHVHLPGPVARDDAPGSISLGQREARGAAPGTGHRACPIRGVAVDHHVDVHGRSAKRAVTWRAAYEPGLPAGQSGSDGLQRTGAHNG